MRRLTWRTRTLLLVAGASLVVCPQPWFGVIADLMVTACPLCQVNVESRQMQMELGFDLPVLYLTQLMTLAFGFGAKEAVLSKQIVDPGPVLREYGLLEPVEASS